MAPTLVYCIRHGQTAENVQAIMQGQLDTQLDSVGIEQAAAVAESLKDVKFGVAFSSDLSRAVDTANAILKHHTEVPFRKVAILRERYLGSLQGQRVSQNTGRPRMNNTVETSTAFRERVLKFWDETVIPYVRETFEVHNDRPSCILVVSHGAFIASLARALIDYRDIVESPGVEISWCPNTSITLVEVNMDGSGFLKSFGDISHISRPFVAGNADELNSRHLQ